MGSSFLYIFVKFSFFGLPENGSIADLFEGKAKNRMSQVAATLGVSEDVQELVLTFRLGSVNVATRTVTENEHKTWRRSPRLFQKIFELFRDETGFRLCINTREKITRRVASDGAGSRSGRLIF